MDVEVQANEPPPPLPDYEQPPCPEDGYLVDTGLLGLGGWGLLLGAGYLGATAARRRALDARLLGLRRAVFMPSTSATGARTLATTVV